MIAVFIELPAFGKYREDYPDDEGFGQLQSDLMANPVAGDTIEATGVPEFWLFTLFDKDEMSDLKAKQRAILKNRLKSELGSRRKT